MSISDRLDEIEADAQACMEDRPADSNAVELAMKVPSVLAALRAVLDVCNEATIEARPHGGGKPYMIVPIREVRAAIEAALGEGS